MSLHQNTLKPLVAIVEPSDSQREALSIVLSQFYAVAEYKDCSHALAGISVVPPSVILIDENAGPINGFMLTRQMRAKPELFHIPVVIASQSPQSMVQSRIDDCGANAYVPKPYRRGSLLHVLSNFINDAVELQWDELPPLQREALKNTVEVFNSISDVIDKGEPIAYSAVSDACAPLVEAVNKGDFKGILGGVKEHDNYSYAHSLRVATLLSLFGHTVGLSMDDQRILASGGLLHDVGKMSIPLEVLNKPGRLTEAEFKVMQGHVHASSTYLHSCDLPKGIITIAEQHHEKLNGTGYPLGLQGSQLNDLARMAAIVDVFSALTDRRVYKPPMEAEKALKIMAEDMGPGHLDMHLLALFRETLLDAAADVVQAA